MTWFWSFLAWFWQDQDFQQQFCQLTTHFFKVVLWYWSTSGERILLTGCCCVTRTFHDHSRSVFKGVNQVGHLAVCANISCSQSIKSTQFEKVSCHLMKLSAKNISLLFWSKITLKTDFWTHLMNFCNQSIKSTHLWESQL